MRWDFVSAENSTGFHSPQEARILAEAIDYAAVADRSAARDEKMIHEAREDTKKTRGICLSSFSV
jgi:formate-dependent nitrite reductase cytochrome c552 subunit